VRRRVVDGRDLGRVGEVVAVEPGPIRAVLDAGYVPVVAPLGVDDAGLTYNVNADEAAGAIARALSAEKLILLTDVEGVKDGGGRLISRLTREEVRKLLAEGAIQGGMIPKVECCLDALAGGVDRTHIIDGRILHAVLLEVFTDVGVGTLITR
jgi:acetylglutamate kinase